MSLETCKAMLAEANGKLINLRSEVKQWEHHRNNLLRELARYLEDDIYEARRDSGAREAQEDYELSRQRDLLL